MVMLGNLTIAEIESRVGFKLPDELVQYMNERHQSGAENVAAGKWHCFDIPFCIVCGDRETAQTIHEYLLPHAKKFKQKMQIGF